MACDNLLSPIILKVLSTVKLTRVISIVLAFRRPTVVMVMTLNPTSQLSARSSLDGMWQNKPLPLRVSIFMFNLFRPKSPASHKMRNGWTLSRLRPENIHCVCVPSFYYIIFMSVPVTWSALQRYSSWVRNIGSNAYFNLSRGRLRDDFHLNI